MSSGGTTHIAAVQMSCIADKQANIDKAADLICQAANQGAQIVCLQELFASYYFCQSENHAHFELAEPIPGPTTDLLCQVAAKNEVVIVASLFEKRSAGIYHNTAVVIEADGTLLGSYRKMHIPDDPGYYEKFYFTPGDLGFRAWDTSAGRLGVCICWDQWFPEAARATALHGADIIFYPTAIGWHPAEKAEFGIIQHDAWQTMQRSHAIANGCYVVAVNRVGHEAPDGGEGIEFWGQSFVSSPDGQIIAAAKQDEETVLLAEINMQAIERQRTHWPFLRDRRIDAYADLNMRFVD